MLYYVKLHHVVLGCVVLENVYKIIQKPLKCKALIH